MSSLCRSLALSLMLASCTPLAAQTYTLQALHIPYAPNADTYALGINNRGAVVGYFVVGSINTRGFKRNADAVYEHPIDDPSTLPELDTIATGVNNFGIVSGYYHNYSTSYFLGFLRSQGVFTDYALPYRNTYILGINDNNDLVGQVIDGNNNIHAFATINGVVSILHYPGGTGTRAYGIAADGTVVGYFRQHQHAQGFLRGPAGQYLALNIPGALNTGANGINNVAHKIVGSYDDANFIAHGFVYDYITGLTVTVDWPDPGTRHTELTGINAQGVVVGWAWTYDSMGSRLPAVAFIGTPQ